MRRDELIRLRIADVSDQLVVIGAQLADAVQDVERVEFQLQAHRHDQIGYQAQYRRLKEVPVVSLREFRILLGDLDFMVDVIGGLEKRLAALQAKQRVLSADWEELEATRIKLQNELNVIQVRGNVIPFKRDDDRRDESQDPDRP